MLGQDLDVRWPVPVSGWDAMGALPAFGHPWVVLQPLATSIPRAVAPSACHGWARANAVQLDALDGGDGWSGGLGPVGVAGSFDVPLGHLAFDEPGA
jgi:hypothetical protein